MLFDVCEEGPYEAGLVLFLALVPVVISLAVMLYCGLPAATKKTVWPALAARTVRTLLMAAALSSVLGGLLWAGLISRFDWLSVTALVAGLAILLAPPINAELRNTMTSACHWLRRLDYLAALALLAVSQLFLLLLLTVAALGGPDEIDRRLGCG